MKLKIKKNELIKIISEDINNKLISYWYIDKFKRVSFGMLYGFEKPAIYLKTWEGSPNSKNWHEIFLIQENKIAIVHYRQIKKYDIFYTKPIYRFLS